MGNSDIQNMNRDNNFNAEAIIKSDKTNMTDEIDKTMELKIGKNYK